MPAPRAHHGGLLAPGHGGAPAGAVAPNALAVLLILLIPTGSYFILHQRLMERYTAMEKNVVRTAAEVGRLKQELRLLVDARDDLKEASENVRLALAFAGHAPLPEPRPSRAMAMSERSDHTPLVEHGRQQVEDTDGCAHGNQPWYTAQPAVANGVFANRQTGVYVDVGAGDGIFNSLTYYFEHARCWTGLVVEPTSNEAPKAKRQRPGSIVVEGAVCADDGIGAGFLDVRLNGLWTGWSGFETSMTPQHLAQIDEMVATNSGWTSERISVKCYTLNRLLDDHGFTRVDLLVVSTEGSEPDVLRSADFQRHQIDVILVEVSAERQATVDAILHPFYPNPWRSNPQDKYVLYKRV